MTKDISAQQYYDSATKSIEDGDLLTAIVEASQAITADPRYDEAYMLRATILANMMQYADAISDIDMAISINPDVADYYMKRGELRLKQNDHAGAMEDLKMAANLSPEFLEHLNGLFKSQGEQTENIKPFKIGRNIKNSKQ